MLSDLILLALLLCSFLTVGVIILRNTSEQDKERQDQSQEDEYLNAVSGPYYGDMK